MRKIQQANELIDSQICYAEAVLLQAEGKKDKLVDLISSKRGLLDRIESIFDTGRYLVTRFLQEIPEAVKEVINGK